MKRYVLHLTESQLQHIEMCMEIAEMDLCGGGSFDEPSCSRPQPIMAKLRDRIIKAKECARNNGLKTIKQL